ncbi:phospholipase [Thermosipho ferrireducens]|uniref:phospholipase D n=1 Tax=Thermosipho ferrireducens TaxID=2571116 RepID=A0ABX7S3Y6_9BACT|nr:phospholipase D-like domain-containing protein [Thermosipho ferrireducens]QTA37106.1 phospholipase [Thermosipho ferrireducens]
MIRFYTLSICIMLTYLLTAQVYFTEYGPLTNLIVSFIESSKKFLYISSYSISEPDVINAIKSAIKKDVDVKIISEKPVPELGKFVKIDMEKSLHHAKFMVNENGILFGSANFTESGLITGFNDILVMSKYQQNLKNFFESLWFEKETVLPFPFIVTSANNMENYILTEISKAKKRILLAVYAFTNPKIYTLLKYKESSGLDVKIVTDKWFKNSPLEKFPNGNVKIISNPMLHHKFIIIDDKIIVGSANYTISGLTRNLEIIYKTNNYLNEYLKIFQFLWRYNNGNDSIEN